MLVAVVELDFVDEFFDVLLLGAGADHQHVVRVDDDVLLQSADHGDLVLWERNDRTACVVEVTALFGHGVGIAVLARMLVDRTPRPDVAPAELAAADVDVVGLLHDAVVDRDGAALRKGDLHDVALGVGSDGAHHAAEERVVLGEVFLEGLDDRAHLPHEDARIPVKLTGLQEHPRQFDVGLLGEALDLADGLVVRDLDVAVARVGTRGFDAHGHQRVVLRGEVETLGDDRPEVVFVEDQVIRRGDDHLRSRIALLQSVGCITDAGSRVASDGFAEYLFRPEFRDLFQHEVFVAGVGHDQEIFSRSQFFETLVRHAYKRLAGAEDIEELLGLGLAAFGPEAAADAAGHDDAIGMFVHDELSLRFVFE